MTAQAALFHTTEELPTWARGLPHWLAHNLDQHQPAPRSHYAQLRPCTKCQAPTLNGADGPQYPHIAYTADPTMLTPNEELAAAILRRPTIHLTPTHHGIDGHQRFAFDITHYPANTCLVAPTHACHKPLGTPIPWELLYTPPKENHDDQPPF